jgi:hypothetical protein
MNDLNRDTKIIFELQNAIEGWSEEVNGLRKSLRVKDALIEKVIKEGAEWRSAAIALADIISESAPITWVRPEYLDDAAKWEIKAVALIRAMAPKEG